MINHWILGLLFCLSALADFHPSGKRDTQSIGPKTGGQNNTVLHVCSGAILNVAGSPLTTQLRLNTSFILTTTYCILDRKDPNGTQNLVYKVLIPNDAGPLQAFGTSVNDPSYSLGSNYTVYGVLNRLLDPNQNLFRNYSVNVTTPPGVHSMMNISINPNDIGIIQLDSMIDLPNSRPTILQSPDNISVGLPVYCLGFGAPDFLTLHTTSRTDVIYSVDLATNQPPADLFFFHDSLADSPQTTPATSLEAIETGDEGCAIINSQNEQIGIGLTTWRVNLNNQSLITYASVAARVDNYLPYINAVLNSFAQPNSTLLNITNSTPAEVQSSSVALIPNTLFVFSLLAMAISSC